MIKVKSPTRVDLAGGTIDLWPLYNFIGSAKTLNVAIDIYTYAELEMKDISEILIESEDLNQKWSFKNYDEFIHYDDSSLLLFQKVISKFYSKHPHVFKHGFNLKIKSESPIGGGLGASSSLVISLIKAFAQFTGHRFHSVHEKVQWAHHIEAEVLNTPTGTQDYYPAVSGGLCEIDYSAFGIELHVSNPDPTPLMENFLLVYTGKSHQSGLNNFEVLKSAVEKNPTVMTALNQIKKIAEEMKVAFHQKNWRALPDLFKREYLARVQLTPAFVSPEIEKLHQICLSNGADAVKICGAGGGGCVLVWVAPEHRPKVIQACEKEKFQCLNAKPVSPLT